MRLYFNDVSVIWSPFCVKVAIPVTLLSLAEPIVAIACFADGAERIPACCCPLPQLIKANEMLISRKNEVFAPRVIKLFFIVGSSVRVYYAKC